MYKLRTERDNLKNLPHSWCVYSSRSIEKSNSISRGKFDLKNALKTSNFLSWFYEKPLLLRKKKLVLQKFNQSIFLYKFIISIQSNYSSVTEPWWLSWLERHISLALYTDSKVEGSNPDIAVYFRVNGNGQVRIKLNSQSFSWLNLPCPYMHAPAHEKRNIQSIPRDWTWILAVGGRRPETDMVIWKTEVDRFGEAECQGWALTLLTECENWLVQSYKTEGDHLKK